MLLTLAQRLTRTVVMVVALAIMATGLVASTAWAETPRGRAGTHPPPPSRSHRPPGGTPRHDTAVPLTRRVSPSGDMGHDVSHPQCGVALPTDDGSFGIVGINEGRPFTTNPCISAQYQWAKGTPYGAGVYLNTSNPAPGGAGYWPRSGSQDPVLCIDARSTTDAGCTYDYGWHAAANALSAAMAVDRGMTQHTWWLDVEIENRWGGNGMSNTAMVQGMNDYLRSHGVAEVGLYSTGYQWRKITGGYTASTAANYRTAWKPQFTPMYSLDNAPLWLATYTDSNAAKTMCTTSFTGAKTRLVQYGEDEGGFDTNLVC
ncbi:hypothetical protein GCM10009608_01410 [Pseudonocardia alaniniphila]